MMQDLPTFESPMKTYLELIIIMDREKLNQQLMIDMESMNGQKQQMKLRIVQFGDIKHNFVFDGDMTLRRCVNFANEEVDLDDCVFSFTDQPLDMNRTLVELFHDKKNVVKIEYKKKSDDLAAKVALLEA